MAGQKRFSLRISQIAQLNQNSPFHHYGTALGKLGNVRQALNSAVRRSIPFRLSLITVLVRVFAPFWNDE
jgi:hypothetical protein